MIRRLHHIALPVLMAVTVNVTAQDLQVATFDDNPLDPESFWDGDHEEEGFAEFRSGSFTFPNFYDGEYNYYAFWGYSNCTGNTFTDYSTDQFNTAPGGAYEGENYGVAYVADFNGPTYVHVDEALGAVTIPGMYITNTAWVVDAILNGDGLAGPFAEGDYLTLDLTGFDAEGNASTHASYYLADYRSANSEERYYLDTWRWVDLSVLGPVTKVQLAITSTKGNVYGPTTPTYVAVDSFGAENPEDGLSIATVFRSQMKVAVTGSTAYVTAPGARSVMMVDVQGRIVGCAKVDAEGRATVSVTGHRGGFYVLTTDNGMTSKVVLR